jgi:hypothetical protein
LHKLFSAPTVSIFRTHLPSQFPFGLTFLSVTRLSSKDTSLTRCIVGCLRGTRSAGAKGIKNIGVPTFTR